MVDYSKIKTFIKTCSQNLQDEEHCKSSFLQFIDAKEEQAESFIQTLSTVRTQLNEDAQFFLECDPAADSLEEVRIAYPGFLAITNYRIAHILRKMGYLVESRIISEIAHSKTGIDIHPGATIGSPFFIDHGTGIVIGETTIIGKRVKIYQGVTLGALSLSKGYLLKGSKRHPTVSDDVTIYSNASLLGDITIGDDVTIGSSVFLTESVPAHTKVGMGKPILTMKHRD